MKSELDDVPQTIVGISFDDRFRAHEFMTATSRLASKHLIRIHDAVIVTKDDAGATHVVETVDPSPGRSAASGAMWAGLIGLFVAGPVGWIAGGVIGAGAGAITAKVVDFGVPEAMWHLQVKDFPAIVTMDASGNSLHKDVEAESAKALAALKG